MSELKTEITKDNLDELLREIAKEYRKRAGKNMPAEIILVGGASVLINYGFRAEISGNNSKNGSKRGCPSAETA